MKLKLFTVWTVEGEGYDRNYLVRARNEKEAEEVIRQEGEGKTQPGAEEIIEKEFIKNFLFTPEDIPTEAGSWYLYDEGT